MRVKAVIGVDIGTSSSKGILVAQGGRILRKASRSHEVSRPEPGWAEMDAAAWWTEFVELSRELLDGADAEIVSVGVSGMGPCVLVTDDDGTPLRPAILYGVDMRATEQIERLTRELGGAELIRERCGSELSTQAVGPKLAWILDHEPEVFASARRLFMPSSWLVWNLTGMYILDHHSASQSTPLYDSLGECWLYAWTERIAPQLVLPDLAWPGDIVGPVTSEAASLTGLPAGVPVIAGTIDAWSEAVSVGALNAGDLMLMYGTTMFLVNTVHERVTYPTLWGTAGVFPGTHCLAGGMATGGAVTAWLRDLFGSRDYPELLALAALSDPGANGLLMLPYFVGERTPIADPLARGVIVGLTLGHRRGDLYRAALESIGFGVRHNIEAILDAGGSIDRIVAVGGGAQGRLWPQIVSDITGCAQVIPAQTIGASLGAAFLAACAVSPEDIGGWNPSIDVQHPREEFRDLYDRRYALYRELYPATAEVVHALATV